MGIYQSTPHVFVEPIGYGFEDPQDTSKVVIVSPIKKQKAIRNGACYRCIRRTKTKLLIEDRALSRYNASTTGRARSERFLEAAGIEVKLASEMLDWAGLKHAESTEFNDKAPQHLKRQLKDAHSRYRLAIDREAHCYARVVRKEKALASNSRLYTQAKENAIEAMNKQVECAARRSIKCP